MSGQKIYLAEGAALQPLNFSSTETDSLGNALVLLRAIGDDLDFDFGKVFVDPRRRCQIQQRNEMLHWGSYITQPDLIFEWKNKYFKRFDKLWKNKTIWMEEHLAKKNQKSFWHFFLNSFKTNNFLNR